MKKTQLHFSQGGVSYKLLRKFRNLNQRIRTITTNDSSSEKEIQRLITKLKQVYHKIARLLSRTGVKLAGTAMALILATTVSSAQITFERVIPNNPLDGVDVGSFASPVFADLDNDGDVDAFIGRNLGTINYYKNTGTDAAPVFAVQTGTSNPFDGVDVGSSASPAFADLDNDGDLDAFIGEFDGSINYYKNTGTVAAPVFAEQTGATNPFDGVDVGSSASPVFADLDNDGDLDAFIGEANGTIKYYKNTGSVAVPVFAVQVGTANPFAGVHVGNVASPVFADLDNDGDLDAFIGERLGRINYYKNTGSVAAPVFTVQTGVTNPFNGVDVGGYASPVFADLDNDGDMDAFIGELSGTIKYYRNTGTAVAPVFAVQIGSDHPFLGGVDVGDYATPVFEDLDNDGDLDAFIGEFNGTINYYKNTGSVASPVFTEQTGAANPFDGVDVGEQATPVFADLDNDGDLDAFIGDYYGTIKYYENTGTVAAPVFAEQTGAANPLAAVGDGYPSPVFADLDNDGDLDAFIGEYYGTINYYENTGTVTAPVFTEQTGTANPFDRVDVGYRASPAFVDVDNDGDLDAFIGESDGNINYYKNTGSDAAPIFTEQIGAANPLDGVVVGSYASPVFADLDNDGDMDAFIGAQDGFIRYYENTTLTSTSNQHPVITSNGGGATATISVDENQTAVTTVAATDADGDAITYSITGGAGQSLFSIGATTGVLSFTTVPSFEDPQDADENNTYIVAVVATSGSLTDTQTITVNVQDVNENPVITSNGAAISVDENQTAVTTLAATDVDGDAITFSITGGADQALFSVDASSGVLTFQAAPDFEGSGDNSHEVAVTATDSGTGSLTAVQTITVNVQDVNESPVITSNGGGATATISVDENQTAVTTVVATDVDGDAITFSITGGADQGLFSIASGVLTFKAAPDFEAPADADKDNSYEVAVTATDNGTGLLTDVQTITVNVQDVDGIVTGVDDLSLLGISIYPNPTSDVLNIDQSHGNIQFIRVFDYSGKILMEESTIGQSAVIDLSKLKTGIYIIGIQTDAGLINRRIEKK